VSFAGVAFLVVVASAIAVYKIIGSFI